MRVCIPGSVALLVLSIGSVHAQEAARLRVGTPVRATLPGDGALRYELTLPKSQFVAGRVDQDGVDATVTITGPANKRVARAERIGPPGAEGTRGGGGRTAHGFGPRGD